MPTSTSNPGQKLASAGNSSSVLAKAGLDVDLKRIAVMLVVGLAVGLIADIFTGQNYQQRVAGSQAAPRQGPKPPPGIDARTAHELSSTGEAVLVDVRSAGSYRKEHAAAAINLPEYVLAAKEKGADVLAKVPKDTHLIVYCSSMQCSQAARGAMLLNTLGYAKVSTMTGGIEGWKNAGLPTEKGQENDTTREEKK